MAGHVSPHPDLMFRRVLFHFASKGVQQNKHMRRYRPVRLSSSHYIEIALEGLLRKMIPLHSPYGRDTP